MMPKYLPFIDRKEIRNVSWEEMGKLCQRRDRLLLTFDKHTTLKEAFIWGAIRKSSKLDFPAVFFYGFRRSFADDMVGGRRNLMTKIHVLFLFPVVASGLWVYWSD